jgi:hypothetical protein
MANRDEIVAWADDYLDLAAYPTTATWAVRSSPRRTCGSSSAASPPPASLRARGGGRSADAARPPRALLGEGLAPHRCRHTRAPVRALLDAGRRLERLVYSIPTLNAQCRSTRHMPGCRRLWPVQGRAPALLLSMRLELGVPWRAHPFALLLPQGRRRPRARGARCCEGRK